MSAVIALQGYMLACIAFRWRNRVGCGSFCKDEDLGRKQPELPWYVLETISFHLGWNSRDLAIRWGIGGRGCRLARLQVSRISMPCYFFFYKPALSLSPFVGINTFQRMSSIPLTGECTSHARRQNSCKDVCCVSSFDGHARVRLTPFFLLSRFSWRVNTWIDFPKVSERLTHRRVFLTSYFDFDKSEEVGLYRFQEVRQ